MVSFKFLRVIMKGNCVQENHGLLEISLNEAPSTSTRPRCIFTWWVCMDE